MGTRPRSTGVVKTATLLSTLLLLSAGIAGAYELERAILGAAAVDQTDGTYHARGTLGIAAAPDQTDGTYAAGVGFWNVLYFDTYTGVPGEDPAVPAAPPARLELFPNSPNPFNPTTKIPFALPQATHATMKIYDLSGREVVTLLDREMPAGHHSLVLNSNELASGIYFYRLTTTDGKTMSRRMTLVK